MRTPNNERLTPDIAEELKGRKDSGPERRCILSGEHGTRDALLRLAISPPNSEGVCQVLPDPNAKAPGRGAWIGVSRAELEAALAKGRLKGALMRAFGKSLGGYRLEIPADLPERIEAALTRSLLDRLGLELRAGHVVLGTARIDEQARGGRVELLLHASDASEDGRKKLDQAWRVGRDAEGSGERGIVLPLDRAALSVALGRDNVVHLALNNGAAAGRIQGVLARLLHYMGGNALSADIGELGGDPASSGRHDEQLNV